MTLLRYCSNKIINFNIHCLNVKKFRIKYYNDRMSDNRMTKKIYGARVSGKRPG